MIVDIFYLVLPDNLELVFDEEDIKKFNNIRSMLNFIDTRYYDEKTDKEIYLYAFTDNSKYADLYEEMHDKRIFKRIRKEMKKKEFKEFRKENIGSEIIIVNPNIDESHLDDRYILCCRNERNEISESMMVYVFELLSEICLLPYDIFKGKYIESLDRLMYCTFCKLQTDYEYMSYQMSYGCSAEGYLRRLPEKEMYQFNSHNLYFDLFHCFLAK